MSDNRDEREWIITFAKTPSELYAKHREMLAVIKSQAAELADARDALKYSESKRQFEMRRAVEETKIALDYCGLEAELADAKAEVARLRDALNHSLHAFRAQLSHGQRKGLAYGELTCLIALGSEPEHGRMGNCLTLGEETEHRKRIALSALDANIGELK